MEEVNKIKSKKMYVLCSSIKELNSYRRLIKMLLKWMLMIHGKIS